jgi:hypothetical protein
MSKTKRRNNKKKQYKKKQTRRYQKGGNISDCVDKTDPISLTVLTSDDIIKIPTEAKGDDGQSMYTCFTRESFKQYLNDQIMNKNKTFDAIVNPTNRKIIDFTNINLQNIFDENEYAELLRIEQENRNRGTDEDEDEFEDEDEVIDRKVREIGDQLRNYNNNENNLHSIDDKIGELLVMLSDEFPNDREFIGQYKYIMNILKEQIDNIIEDSEKKQQLYDILNKYNMNLHEPIFGITSIVDNQGGGKKQFLYNPNDPKRSFDVYIDKDPSDTISIKYATISDVKNTIKKLEKLYKEGKYSHKRIWQVGMIMKVRLEAIKKYKKKLYPNAKNVTERYNLANKYFKFLSKRTKMNEKERKKSRFVI